MSSSRYSRQGLIWKIAMDNNIFIPFMSNMMNQFFLRCCLVNGIQRLLRTHLNHICLPMSLVCTHRIHTLLLMPNERLIALLLNNICLSRISSGSWHSYIFLPDFVLMLDLIIRCYLLLEIFTCLTVLNLHLLLLTLIVFRGCFWNTFLRAVNIADDRFLSKRIGVI